MFIYLFDEDGRLTPYEYRESQEKRFLGFSEGAKKGANDEIHQEPAG